MDDDKDVVAVDARDDLSSATSNEAQAGVKGIEAISTTWTKWSLIVAYAG